MQYDGELLSALEKLSEEDKISLISALIEQLKEKNTQKKINGIPLGIFSNKFLSTLEAVVKYTKENLKLRFVEIANNLNRSSKTIWTTYRNASKKMPSEFSDFSEDIIIPFSVFSDRRYSTLESLVIHLKKLDMSNREIAKALNLDDSTIWTIASRAKKKSGMENIKNAEEKIF